MSCKEVGYVRFLATVIIYGELGDRKDSVFYNDLTSLCSPMLINNTPWLSCVQVAIYALLFVNKIRHFLLTLSPSLRETVAGDFPIPGPTFEKQDRLKTYNDHIFESYAFLKFPCQFYLNDMM